ncbi:Mannose-binding lectin [Cordyceps fumosorosea ARSEF 2679]|uniref:Mannose-binding lectin n=1 Tax=Cordyceps fumosorosea (strain ARSEF 2679) TaxID=1081104 RepID=A0A167R7I4_CORFA|nr:Mannose-binding lectin [Cordyceps fumosorosea ARSEF 2679]OAA58344.1 Mannose-binding lectin [Cordyceps fumosorosea ARSEF 2679]
MTERVVGPFGRNTGHPFQLFPNQRSTARRFTVRIGQGSGDAQGFIVVKGIEIEWFNGERVSVYNRPQPDDSSSTFEFQEGERASWTVWAGWRIVRFEISTTLGRTWAFGGTSGTRFPNIVSNGQLIGMELSSGWEVDWANITFLVHGGREAEAEAEADVQEAG